MPKSSAGVFTRLGSAPFAVCLATLFLISLDRVLAPLWLTEQVKPLSLAASLALVGIHAGGQLIVMVFLLAFETTEKKYGALKAAVLTGLIGAVGFWVVGAKLSSGDWISQQSYAWSLPVLAGFLGILIMVGVLALASRFPYSNHENNTKFRLASLVFAVLSATCLLVDAVVLKRIYHELHFLLYALATYFAGIAAHRFGLDIFGSTRKRTHIFLWVCTALIITPNLYLCSSMGNGARAELMLKSQVAANLVQHLPSPRGDTLFNVLNRIDDYSEPLSMPRHAKIEQLNIEDDWNIILVVVDALRADALPPARRDGQVHATEDDTPFMNKWIENTYRFHYAYAQGNNTEISMPAMFRSIPPFENDNKTGVPLGSYLTSLGRTPLAAVNSLFFEPRKKAVSNLLTGFEKLAVYQENAMHLEISQMLQLVEKERGNPFFAWFHFYCTHSPGFAGERLLKKSDGSWPKRYKQSLKWLDSEFESLVTGLREKGILDKTVIIVTGDHGEGLGDHGLDTHGSYMFEEEVRIPLSIWIPGKKGGDILSTVGNVDIVPTIAQILGGPINPGHRGRSLLPLLADAETNWDHTYYMQNSTNNILAIVRGRQKLIYHPKERVFFRYDLEKDPKEKTNLFTATQKLDQELVDHLAFANPKLFGGEVRRETTREMLVHRLNSVDLSRSSGHLKFVLKVSSFDKNIETTEILLGMFKETKSAPVKALIFKHAYLRDRKRWSQTMAEHLMNVAGTDSELALVEEMAALGQGALVPIFVASRFSWWIKKGDLDATATWLEFLGNWNVLTYRHFAPLLLLVLDNLQKESLRTGPNFVRTAKLTLGSIAKLSKRMKLAPMIELEQAVKPYLEHESITLRTAAGNALEQVGTKKSFSSLSTILSSVDEPLQVKQAAMKAIAKIDGPRAVPIIVQSTKELQLTLDAINLLGVIGGLEAQAYLNDVVKNHYNKTIKNRARRQLKRVNRKLK